MNKKILWMLLGIALVFGFTATSCGDDTYYGDYTMTFENRSSYTVSVTSSDLSPSSFNLSANSSRTVTAYKANILYDYEPKDKVDNSHPRAGSIIFTNKGSSATGTVPPSVIPDEIKNKIKSAGMPINEGTNPPDIVGQYLMDKYTLVGSSLSGDTIGSTNWADLYIEFAKSGGKLSYREKQGTGQTSSGDVNVEIVGNGSNFTAFFVSTGTSYGISIKQSTVISGTLTSTGISNCHYAFVMLEKGPDPSSQLVPVNTYRVFKDGDGVARKTNW